PGCSIVLAAEKLTMQVVKKAQGCGIGMCVSLEDEPQTILDTVRRAGALGHTRANVGCAGIGGESKVVSVFSPKGGTGKTTVAVNIASAVAMLGRKAAIVDLNLDCACVTLFLDMQAKDTVAELSQERGNLTMDALRTYTVQHYSGLTILAGPNSPEDGEFVQARTIEAAIAVMRPFFDCIVIDLPTNFEEHTLTAIENSDLVLVVLQPDIASVKAAHTAITILNSLRMGDKTKFVYNKSAKSSFLGIKDVRKALGRDPDYVLPLDEQTADKCQCIGRPIVAEASRTPLAKALKAIAREVVG
ncbi:MAG TPA: AAA family ATPase, partial [Clostridia bacterium]|nr:AAA family ATPase [Clostridia bacterium]